MHYYFLCHDTNHGNDRLTLLSLSEYNALLQDESVCTPLFYSDLDSTKSYLVELPSLNTINEIFYGKKVRAAKYSVTFSEYSFQYRKADDSLIGKMTVEIADDREFSDWLNKYYASLKCFSPEREYAEDKSYAVIVSDGQKFVSQSTETFSCSEVEIEF